MKGIISIQSHVVYGHAGNSCAVFPMQRLGHEVFPMNTVQFSNHTQYPQGWTGEVVPTEVLCDLTKGLLKIEDFDPHSAVVTGYMGSPAHGEAVKGLLDHVFGIYVCDPVMPDPSKGCKMADGMPEMWADLVQYADVIVPNQYELEQLSGCVITDVPTCIIAINTLKQKLAEAVSGQLPIILVKHLQLNDDMFTMLLSTPDGEWLAQRPNYAFDKAPVGVGDLITACFTANLLNEDSPVKAFELTHNTVGAILEQTWRDDEYELQIIKAQDQIANPQIIYPAVKL